MTLIIDSGYTDGGYTPGKLLLKKDSVAPLLLDSYPGAAAAYSLRSLSLAYGGPVVRVRRSSDNTEADFTAAQVPDGTLTTFCGAGDGFVRTWYDQTGGSADATQTTTANQPKIVSSGALVTHASKPAISWSGNPVRLNADSLRNKATLSSFIVKNTSDTDYAIFNGASNAYSYIATQSSSSTGIIANYGTPTLFANNVQFTGTTRGQVYTHLDGYKLEVHLNASISSFWNWFDIGVYNRGSNGNSFDYVGTIQELIFYPSDVSSNRVAIQNNINAHYSIY